MVLDVINDVIILIDVTHEAEVSRKLDTGQARGDFFLFPYGTVRVRHFTDYHYVRILLNPSIFRHCCLSLPTKR